MREHHSGGLLQQGVRRNSDTTSYDFAQPIKRTRSDQSLSGLCIPSDLASQQQHHHHHHQYKQQLDETGAQCFELTACATSTSPSMPLGRPQLLGTRRSWASTLPVVMSDHNSSTNSLGSMESDLTRSSMSHSALQLLGSGSSAASRQLPQHPGAAYMQATGSAASLQQVALGAGGGAFTPGGAWQGANSSAGMLCRSQSDYSDTTTASSTGGMSQVPQLQSYSPPPSTSPGPVCSSVRGTSGAAAAPPCFANAHTPLGGLPPDARGDTLGQDATTASLANATAVGEGAYSTTIAAQVPAQPQQPQPSDPARWRSSSRGNGRQVFGSAVAAFNDVITGMCAPAAWGQQPVVSGGGGGSWIRDRIGFSIGVSRGDEAPAPTHAAAPADEDPPSGPLVAPLQPDEDPTTAHVQLALSPSGAGGMHKTDSWDFARRQRQVQASGRGKGSGSSSFGRRRSSIEASMPWRTRLDEAIAAVEGPQAVSGGEQQEGVDALQLQPLGLEVVAPQSLLVIQAGGQREEQQYGGQQRQSCAEQQLQQQVRSQLGSWEQQPHLQQQYLRVDAGAPAGSLSPGSGGGSSMGGSDRRSSTESESEGGGSGAGGSGGAGDSRSAPIASVAAAEGGRNSSSSDDMGRSPRCGARVGKMRRNSVAAVSGYYSRLHEGGAAFELFVRLNRARQTLDFAKRQAQEFAELDLAELTIWESLDMLPELREYEAGMAPPSEELDPAMPLKEHAFQVAELCRLAFPDKEWLALVGLIHGLGKLLAHPSFGSQPQWAVAGETYPLGCRFAPQIGHAELFSANPDRRRRGYSTPEGIYAPGCGLKEVYMSWGAPEYLYLVMVLNQVALPEEALFVLRYQKFYSLTRSGGAYRNLMSPDDEASLQLLSAFQRLAVYKRVELPPEALRGQAFFDYYNGLINKYIGADKLYW